MRLTLSQDSHILLLPPHVEHIQFSKNDSIDAIKQAARTYNIVELRSLEAK